MENKRENHHHVFILASRHTSTIYGYDTGTVKMTTEQGRKWQLLMVFFTCSYFSEELVYTSKDDTEMSVFNFLQNVMILGDFRADGVYVTPKEMEEIRIRSDKNFHWLIADDVDTTAQTSNDHTYDRQRSVARRT